MIRRAPALLFGLLLVLSLLPSPARAAAIELVYDLYAGGFHIGTATAQVSVADGRYQIDSSLRTTGFVGWMTGFVSEAATGGRVAQGDAVPDWHRVDNLWRGTERTVRMRYSGNIPHVEVKPAAPMDDRPEVTEADRIGAIDPLSAALRLAFAADGPPGQVIAVYDGRRRYDLTVAALAEDTVNAPLYSGPALRMQVGWKRVGGYAKPPSFMPTAMPDRGDVWFMPARDESLGLRLPVRMVIDSPFGAAVIRLVALRPLS